jgi:hypothetical protein
MSPHAAASLEGSAMAFYNQTADLTNFVISFLPNPMGDFGIFAKGYTLAADRLAGILLAAPRFSNYEAYPVVFLYRHALELALKHIIYSTAQLAAFTSLDAVENRLQNTHDLTQLSGTAHAILVRLFPRDELLRQTLVVVTETCQEFSEIDPQSKSYRYPIDRKGQHSSKQHRLVNLRSFAERMSSVLEDLNTIQFGLNIETDVAQEVYEIIENILSSVAKVVES